MTRLVVVLSALALLGLAACGTNKPGAAAEREQGDGGSAPSDTSGSGFPVTLKDAAGRSHTFDKPAKVACLWYGCMEDMADLGLVPVAAAVTKEEAKTPFLFPVGPPTYRIDDDTSVEEWAKAEPDTIVTIIGDNPDFDVLEQAAPIFRYHYPLHPTTFRGLDALKENLRLLGRMTGEPDKADAAIARFDKLLADMAKAAPPDAADRSVAFLYASDDGTYTMPSKGHGALLCDALAKAKLGHCIPSTASGEINAEQFLREDPDWIVYSGYKETYKDRKDPVWNRLTAVREGRVYDTENYVVGESLRILEHAIQEFGYQSLGPDSGIEDPGPFFDYNPTG